MHDVVVVGGGPAGLVAARDLAQRGVSVMLIDEAGHLGGQYYKRRPPEVVAWAGDYRPEGTRLVAEVMSAGVDCRLGRLAWAAEADAVLLSDPRTGVISRHRGRFLLLATGASEKVVPFPGWTLPGVITAGCALHLATVDRVAPGARVAIAGTGPFLLLVAEAMLEVGAEVVGVFECNTPYTPSRAGLEAATHLARFREFLSYRRRLRHERVSVHQGWRVVEAKGGRAVTSVVIGTSQKDRPGLLRELEVDALCVSFGFSPNAELAQILGCELVLGPGGDMVPLADASGRTSLPWVFVAGEVRGVAGVRAAMVRGRLAAWRILELLGKSPGPESAIRRLRRESIRLERFATLLERLYPVPGWLYQQIPDSAIVCRCEAVTAADIRSAARHEWNDVHAVKGVTRAGMGICQGRECRHAVRALSGISVETSSFPTARFPVKPIRYPRIVGDEAGR